MEKKTEKKEDLRFLADEKVSDREREKRMSKVLSLWWNAVCCLA